MVVLFFCLLAFAQLTLLLYNIHLSVTQPFYGRSFKNTIDAETLYQSHEGADDSTWHEDEGVPQCEFSLLCS